MMTMLLLILIGICSIVSQVVILRELSVSLNGLELIYLMALAVWLIGNGAGTWINSRWLGLRKFRIESLLLIWSLLLFQDLILINGFRHLLQATPGADLPLLQQILLIVVSTLPISLLNGMIFRLAVQRFVSEHKTFARAYAVECLGGVIGGALATLVLLVNMQNLTLGLICCLAVALTAWGLSLKHKHSVGIILGGLFVLGGLVSLAIGDSLRLRLIDWTHPDQIRSHDSPYGRLTLTRQAEQINLFLNNNLLWESFSAQAEESVHLPALQCRKPHQILLLGDSPPDVIRELLKHQPHRIDCVIIDRLLFETFRDQLTDSSRLVYRDARVRVIFRDPREYLFSSNLSYDLILSRQAEPVSGQANRFYTQEFFEQCANRLTEGGVFSFQLPGSENLWTPLLTQKTGSVYAALTLAFRAVEVIPGADNLFIASQQKGPDLTEIIETFKHRALVTRLLSDQYLTYLYQNDRFQTGQELLRQGDFAINRDAHPICYQYALGLWLSRFFPSLLQSTFGEVGVPDLLHSWVFWIVLIGLLLILALLRRRERGRRLVLVFYAGFFGMIVEAVLLLLYQTQRGVLFQDLGLLLMAFMLGLALGTGGFERFWQDRSKFWDDRTGGIVLILLTTLINSWLVLHLMRGWPVNLMLVAGSLAAVGAIVGMIIAYGSLVQVPVQEQIIAPVYFADLMGGCVGTLVGSLLLLPVLGLTLTMGLMVVLSGLLLVLFVK